MKKLLFLAMAVFGMTALWVSAGYGHSNSSPNLECTSCHQGSIVPELVKIQGVPRSYVPGKKYAVTVTVQSSLKSMGDSIGGFAVSATAGELIVKDKKNTQMSDMFLTHTQEGSLQRKWSFEWKAPSKKGEAAISIMAVAANGDYSSEGDEVGAASYSVVSAK
ncbi:MAG: hypothetical protein K8I29_16830 [Alphaproteobacteria bacterium]|uniref:Reelin domain-containing protein n=1 Tax=Candidatus Nitrobium versatile TaxID=2884831 RepID=A0A953M2P6_9BACT|nr:hypothetical protein [Candidatus Nitrobium versatile]